MLERLKEKSRVTGLPAGRLVRIALEKTLSDNKDADNDKNQAWKKFAGVIKGGPPDLSSRKGYSRG